MPRHDYTRMTFHDYWNTYLPDLIEPLSDIGSNYDAVLADIGLLVLDGCLAGSDEAKSTNEFFPCPSRE